MTDNSEKLLPPHDYQNMHDLAVGVALEEPLALEIAEQLEASRAAIDNNLRGQEAPAPLSRQEMIQKLIGQLDSILPYYQRSIDIESERGPSKKLNALKLRYQLLIEANTNQDRFYNKYNFGQTRLKQLLQLTQKYATAQLSQEKNSLRARIYDLIFQGVEQANKNPATFDAFTSRKPPRRPYID